MYSRYSPLRHIKFDLPAGLVVFLVALPLCLGVALASGAPNLVSGVIAGIVGGVLVGALSQSHISVSGPAAGLTAVVLGAIKDLGAFDTFLLAVVIAGIMQIIAGIARSGFIADYIPSNVIKGLLAAIGIILILKQIPHAFGLDRDAMEDFSFFQPDGENTFTELLNIADNFAVGAIIIAVVSLIILGSWSKLPWKAIIFPPPSLVVVLVGVALNQVFIHFFPTLALGVEHLVNLPAVSSASDVLTFPNFSQLTNPKVWTVAIEIAIIASLETLLNLEAVQNLDPHKRFASPNRELIAQGIGNMVSGSLGGLPVTSVIVRSSVNIHSGARSKTSTILHGVFLFVSLLFLASVLNTIPIASLAAILLLTGYKLTDLHLFKDMLKKGWDQFIPFVATIIAIVLTDLLIGVLIGLGISIFFLLLSNFKNPFRAHIENVHGDEIQHFKLPNQVSFLNKAPLKKSLWSIPLNSRVIIDGTQSTFIDLDVQEVLETFRTTVAKDKYIKLNTIGFNKNLLIQNEIEFSNVLDKASQQKLSPEEIVNFLKQGNERFLRGEQSEKYLSQQVAGTARGQNPFAVILSCIDSRTTTEHIFDLGLGDIFSIRIAGNVLNKDIVASIEYATHLVGVRLIVILGHTHCGAITGACNDLSFGNFNALASKIKPAIEAESTIVENRVGSNPEFVNKVSSLNVKLVAGHLLQESELIRTQAANGTVKIVGAMYDVETGQVTFND